MRALIAVGEPWHQIISESAVTRVCVTKESIARGVRKSSDAVKQELR